MVISSMDDVVSTPGSVGASSGFDGETTARTSITKVSASSGPMSAPLPVAPYARSLGMSSWMRELACTPTSPSSHPGITSTLADHDRERTGRHVGRTRVVAVVELHAVPRANPDVVDDHGVTRFGDRAGSLFDHRHLEFCRDLVGDLDLGLVGIGCKRCGVAGVGRLVGGCGLARRVVAGVVVAARACSEQQGGGDEQGEGPAHCDDATCEVGSAHVSEPSSHRTLTKHLRCDERSDAIWSVGSSLGQAPPLR